MQRQFLFCCFLAFLVSIYEEIWAQEKIRLKGTVTVYGEERMCVDSAMISIDGYPTLWTYTDSSGRFTLLLPKSLIGKTVRIRITKEGMKVWTKDIEIKREMPPETITLFPVEPKLGIGISAGPSISLKHNFAPKYSWEMRGAYSWNEPEIIVIGGRLYYNFTRLSRGVLYTGGEMNYTKFSYQSPVKEMNKTMNPEDISGDGYTISLFIGGEYFLDENDKFSLILDIGPIYTNINDECGSSIKEWNWVVNVGVLFYP